LWPVLCIVLDAAEAVTKFLWGGVTKKNTCDRHHNQLSKSCVQNFSRGQLNQSCLAESKAGQGVLLLSHEAK